MGGVDHGHKGYAFALLVETLTGALAGHGRADPKEGWGASVFLKCSRPRSSAEKTTSADKLNTSRPPAVPRRRVPA